MDQPEERLSTSFTILSPTVEDNLEDVNEGGEEVDRMSHRGEF